MRFKKFWHPCWNFVEPTTCIHSKSTRSIYYIFSIITLYYLLILHNKVVERVLFTYFHIVQRLLWRIGDFDMTPFYSKHQPNINCFPHIMSLINIWTHGKQHLRSQKSSTLKNSFFVWKVPTWESMSCIEVISCPSTVTTSQPISPNLFISPISYENNNI